VSSAQAHDERLREGFTEEEISTVAAFLGRFAQNFAEDGS
jgi:hypothetical protein